MTYENPVKNHSHFHAFKLFTPKQVTKEVEKAGKARENEG